MSLPGHTKCLPGVVIAGTGYRGKKRELILLSYSFRIFPQLRKWTRISPEEATAALELTFRRTEVGRQACEVNSERFLTWGMGGPRY